MPEPLKSSEEYLTRLKQRGKQSHVYRKYQMLGLEIARALGDERHKALYINLARERNGDALLRVAKSVAERKDVKNKGAYFMRTIAENAPKPKKSMYDSPGSFGRALNAAKKKPKQS